jgi:hypothetical protein
VRRFSRFFRWYGAGPLHLLTMVGCLALAAYAAADLFSKNPVGIAVWLVAAVVGHDLILVPLYTLADRSVIAIFRHREPRQPEVPWINYLRVPVVLSGLLLLIWFPLILRLPKRFTYTTTLSLDPYLWHWLAVTGALFLLSATAYAVRLRTTRHRPPPHRPKHGKPPPSEHPPPQNAPPDNAPRQPARPESGPGQPGRHESAPGESGPPGSGSGQPGRHGSAPGESGLPGSGPGQSGPRESGSGQPSRHESAPRQSGRGESGPPWDLPA